ncbi:MULTISPECIES: TrbG/VirB9 family P-type conjugative transfer protein [unclassified Candidatus Tisiphia]|jgi:type IV secretion system protein VirB9|uniref:TrbG/VirB9 family P-type conjugative transfer protein n=1 Tax=Candidatus Tisiphia endosymbiont of Sergentomyia squamirostris TaxID=3113639 RepID=A0AAT9G717_9RICK|nr:TrbG/VirB9 family P-type conjugative transfer protein [Rickettsiaceae bacterium]MDD9337409.1 TrbG/VirB9 family P-type conjugative transfer protein [Rickettsiaceae bacterium]MDR0329348.1 TrbG/VirB9 family P-type conjugative transfer protein [Rickettsia sp.]MDR0774961.1 TrbG/VirB9 family P-type conjugative transfer protein [Rickettsia sp.]UCM92278.1 MAG: TrbG/VirB9 family P-type conjugative transfer protein [Rickettsia endosymbiont of Cimex lectularius]
MIIARLLFVAAILLHSVIANACAGNMHIDNDVDDLAITTDNRIKTYIHNPNEVYLLVLHFGFQSSIEFAKNEEIQNIVLGESYAWKMTPLANRLFIKPLEKNIRTNMTIITNKRTYQFDVVSKELEEGREKDLVYVVRFYYPKKRFSTSQ